MKRLLAFLGFFLIGAVLLELDVAGLPLWGKLVVAGVASLGIGWAVWTIMLGAYGLADSDAAAGE